MGMESGPVAVGKGGELRCGPMKKSYRIYVIHKKPAVQQEISCFVLPVFFFVIILLSFLCYLKLSQDTYPVTYFPAGFLPQEAAVVVMR